MKICILVSSNPKIGNSDEEYQNPSFYVNTHSFILKVLTKENAIEGINDATTQGFDFIWNFMQASDTGIDATKYLESTNHPVLGPSSKFISISPLDLKKAANLINLQVPKWILASRTSELDIFGMNYPLTLKPAFPNLEINNNDIIVEDSQQLDQQMNIIRNNTADDILIEEYIMGDDISCLVLETKDGAIALRPVIYEDKKKYRLYDGPKELLEKIQKSSVMAFEALGVCGSGYAKVYLRIRGNVIYVLKVKHTPNFFSRKDSKSEDDFVIEESFVGGHTALVETIILNKQRLETVVSEFAKMAPGYNKYYEQKELYPMYGIWGEQIIPQNDFRGQILDLGCGTGRVGGLVHKHYPNSEMTGIDVCPELAAQAQNYKKIHVGLMENILQDMDTQFDHIVSLAVFSFVDPGNFQLITQRCFHIARKSITFAIEDINDNYKENILKYNSNLTMFSHVDAADNIQPPTKDWKLVWKRIDVLWHSPKTNNAISGINLRFERNTRKNTEE